MVGHVFSFYKQEKSNETINNKFNLTCLVVILFINNKIPHFLKKNNMRQVDVLINILLIINTINLLFHSLNNTYVKRQGRKKVGSVGGLAI